MTATTTTAVLVPIQPTFTDAERLALAGFLAGYRGLTRGGYGPAGRAHPGRVGRTVSRRGGPIRLVRWPLSGWLLAAGPYLLAAFGTRASMAAATVLSAFLTGWLLGRHRVPRAWAAGVWAAVALCTELTAGRASFTVALHAAFGCVLAAGTRPRAGSRWRARAKTAAVVTLALLTSMLSPVAGLFLGVTAGTLVVCGHRRQGLYMGACRRGPR